MIERIRAPFVSWDIIRTTRLHPHSRYSHVKSDDKCPCESGKTYKSCCLRKRGVRRPHIQIISSVPLPDGLPDLEYTPVERPDQ